MIKQEIKFNLHGLIDCMNIETQISQIQNNLSLVSEIDSTDEILQKFDQKESSRDEI